MQKGVSADDMYRTGSLSLHAQAGVRRLKPTDGMATGRDFLPGTSLNGRYVSCHGLLHDKVATRLAGDTTSN
jgi:hypothetical protein